MLSWLKEKSLRGIQPGSPEFFAVQKALILKRPLLKRCYDDWYRRLLEDARSGPPGGVIVELGSGGGSLKDFDTGANTSAVVPPVADWGIADRRLPFEDPYT